MLLIAQELKQLEIQQKDAELHQKAVEFDRIHTQLSQLQEKFQVYSCLLPNN